MIADVSAGIYHINNIAEVIKATAEDEGVDISNKTDPVEFLTEVVPEFGAFVDSKMFVVINNEYYEGYNPVHELRMLIAAYYRLYNVWFFDYSVIGSANAREVANDLCLDVDWPND